MDWGRVGEIEERAKESWTDGDVARVLEADVPWLVERLREVQRVAAEIVPLMREQLEDREVLRQVGDDPEVVIRLLSPFLPSEEKAGE